MLHKGSISTLVFLVSLCLLPRSASAIEGSRDLRIGHLGDGLDAYVHLSSDGERATAVPRIRIKGLQPAAQDAVPENGTDAKNPVAGILRQGGKAIDALLETDGISYRNAVRLLHEAKDSLRKRKPENDRAENSGDGIGGSGGQPSFARSAASD